MELNQRTLVLGGVLVAAVLVLALLAGADLLVVLGLAVVAVLGTIVIYQRAELERVRREGTAGEGRRVDADEDEDEDGNVDLAFVDEYVEPHAGAGLAARPALEDVDAFAPDDELALGATDELVDDGVDEPAYGVTELEVEELPPDAPSEPGLDEEFEEAIAGFEEPSYGAVEVDESEILAAPGMIDETKVTSDQAILGAAHVSSFTPDEEEANEETREILGRVAALLAKYE